MINPEAISLIMSRVMTVEDVTLGGPQQHFVYRVRGHLSINSEAAYEAIDAAVRGMDLLTLLHEENGNHVFYLLPKPATSTKRNWLPPLLFVLTVFSVILAGAANALPPDAIPCNRTPPTTLRDMFASILFIYQVTLANLPAGLPFAFSLLGILGTHELGHYIAGRLNRTPVSMPYFIPLPLLDSFGTMGAVISIRQPPRNRNRLVEIAVAGPFAGFFVGVPLLLYGLSLSHVQAITTTVGACSQYMMEGNSIVYLLAKLAVFGKWLPAPLQYDVAPPLFWLRSFFTGYPWPLPGMDVMVSPIAWGAWVGLLITGINLIPAGQLDGGHMLYAILGDKVGRTLPWIIAAMIGLGLFWSGWFFWAFLVFVFGRMRAVPLDTVTPLSPRHRALAIAGLALFFLVIVPIPWQVFGV